MYFIASIIDFLIVLLLLRFLIKPNETYFHPIYSLIYRISNFLLTPTKSITKTPTQGTIITIIALVVIRGALYVSIASIPLTAGIGTSLLGLFQFIFRAYMVILIISILSRPGFQSSFLNMLERAFLPFYSIAKQFKIQSEIFHFFVFISLWFVYAIFSTVIRAVMIVQTGLVPVAFFYGLAEGLMLTLALFPFPGFFSLVIIIGALLSWVSPDPSNPVVQTIYGINEPLLSPFRRLVPLLGGLDISPIIALLCFNILGSMGLELIGRLIGAL
jgi:YggT family protein